MTDPAIQLDGVSLAFRGMPVLEDVNLRVEPGQFLGLIGPNGGGKSVLLKVILGLLEPDAGTVRVFGRPPGDARGTIAYVPQYARFDSTFPIRVIDVVLMGRLGRGKSGGRFDAQDRAAAGEALERMEIADLAQRQIGKLSGGQLQRVSIARALAVEAPILLLDEPTANLDSPIAVELYTLLESMTPERTIVLVSHDISVMSSHVGSVACLNRHLHYHGTREITREMIDATYGCEVDFLVHRHTHRVLGDHEHEGGGET